MFIGDISIANEAYKPIYNWGAPSCGIWGFPYPRSSSMLVKISPYKPSSDKGIPHDYGNLRMFMILFCEIEIRKIYSFGGFRRWGGTSTWMV